MKTTLILRDELIDKAAAMVKISQKTMLVHMGLEALIEKYSRQRLAALGGSQPRLKMTPRRKSIRNK